MKNLEGLQPARLWYYFKELCHIPRPSKHEQWVVSYLKDFASSHNLNYFQDEGGNVLIRKAPCLLEHVGAPVILQSHLDMVCEKRGDVQHDFLKDAIQAYEDNGWVKARGTTLGADNGIGVAAMLALLEAKDIAHGVLECLFTVDEESGLYGAKNLSSSLLSGDMLINLDSEDDGEICIGCAGGKDTLARLPLQYCSADSDLFGFQLMVSGLSGGHSGDDINKGRGNALKIMGDFVQHWENSTGLPLFISRFEGGNLRNAIPREAVLEGAVDQKNKERLRVELNHFIATVEEQFAGHDKGIRIGLTSKSVADKYWSHDTQQALITALVQCPNGVMEMSDRVEGLVQTSSNLASLKEEEGNLLIVSSQRSDREDRKLWCSELIKKNFEDFGFRVEQSGGYPGWTPNYDSNLLATAQRVHRQVLKEEATIRVVHAGLECGLFLQKYPQWDMISIGPTIRDVHSPDERVEVYAVERFWNYLKALLQELAQE